MAKGLNAEVLHGCQGQMFEIARDTHAMPPCRVTYQSGLALPYVCWVCAIVRRTALHYQISAATKDLSRTEHLRLGSCLALNPCPLRTIKCVCHPAMSA